MPDRYGHIRVDEPSYQLPRPLPLLPTDNRALPCVADPTSYDEDTTPKVRASAARRCRRECPQLAQCTQLLASLIASGATPRGTMAGIPDVRHRWQR